MRKDFMAKPEVVTPFHPEAAWRDRAAVDGAVVYFPVVDAVVIGRNEGARLLACLASLQGQVRQVVYVDSGSGDGSAAAARALGARVVDLDMSQPFTAARARNAGLSVLAQSARPPDFVQFLDGDCQLRESWIAAAIAAFDRDHTLVVVCGRRREAAPLASVYNRLVDAEWDTPIGEAMACGGDALMRFAAVQAVGGYRASLIAGEEPELCQRLRRRGGRILRIPAEMSLHDAAMTRFAQWWQRSRRAGYAFAEGAYLHGRGPDRHWVRETRRALSQGIALPLIAGLGGVLFHPAALGILLFYPAQVLRLWRARLRQRPGPKAGVASNAPYSSVAAPALTAAFFNTLGKFPEGLGAIGFYANRRFSRRARLIEYK